MLPTLEGHGSWGFFGAPLMLSENLGLTHSEIELGRAGTGQPGLVRDLSGTNNQCGPIKSPSQNQLSAWM
jgi:hypothetical protein